MDEKGFLTGEITRTQAYICLAISIILEQIAAACLEACDGFTKAGYTVVLIICLIIMYFFFGKLLTKITLSISYATWTAVGTVSASLIGLLLFGQAMSPAGWVGIGLICIGVFILNIWGEPQPEEQEATA